MRSGSGECNALESNELQASSPGETWWMRAAGWWWNGWVSGWRDVAAVDRLGQQSRSDLRSKFRSGSVSTGPIR